MVLSHDKAWDTVYKAEIRHWPLTYKVYKINYDQRERYAWLCLLKNSQGCWIVCNGTDGENHIDLYEVSRLGFVEQLKTDGDPEYHVYLDIAAQDHFGTFLDCMVYWLGLDHKLTTF